MEPPRPQGHTEQTQPLWRCSPRQRKRRKLGVLLPAHFPPVPPSQKPVRSPLRGCEAQNQPAGLRPQPSATAGEDRSGGKRARPGPARCTYSGQNAKGLGQHRSYGCDKSREPGVRVWGQKAVGSPGLGALATLPPAPQGGICFPAFSGFQNCVPCDPTSPSSKQGQSPCLKILNLISLAKSP